MPKTPIKRALDKSSSHPDFNIGNDTFHTSQKLIDDSGSIEQSPFG